MAGGALFTYSRQAYFIVLLSVVLLLIRKSIILSVIIGVTLVSLAGYLPDSVTQRVDETSQSNPKGGGEEVDASTSSRWEIWAGAMGMLQDNPLGVGLNRFKDNIGNYSSHKHMDAHNFYVLTFAECGPQGLIALLFLMWTLLFGLAAYLRKLRRPTTTKPRRSRLVSLSAHHLHGAGRDLRQPDAGRLGHGALLGAVRPARALHRPQE